MTIESCSTCGTPVVYLPLSGESDGYYEFRPDAGRPSGGGPPYYRHNATRCQNALDVAPLTE